MVKRLEQVVKQLVKRLEEAELLVEWICGLGAEIGCCTDCWV